MISGNKSKSDSLKTQQKNSVKDVLEGIVGANKPAKTADSAATTNSTTKDAVKNVLGGLLGGKKKPKDTAQ